MGLVFDIFVWAKAALGLLATVSHVGPIHKAGALPSLDQLQAK